MKCVQGLVAIGAVFGLCSVAFPAMVVVDDFDTDDEGWVEEGPGSVNWNAGGGYLEIQGGSTNPGVQQSEVHDSAGTGDVSSYPNAPPAAGDWTGTNAASIRFSFSTGSSIPPANLSLYFSDTGGTVWYYDLAVTSSGWSTYWANLIEAEGWYTVGANPFTTSLGSVDEVGILVTYVEGGGEQTYYLDNFDLDDQYVVPEPGTCLTLAAAFLSLGITYRRRLSGSLSRIGKGLKL